MSHMECPNCGKQNFYTRHTCYKCGASLVDGRLPETPVPGSRPSQPTRFGEGCAILAGGLIGGFLTAVLWIVFLAEPFLIRIGGQAYQYSDFHYFVVAPFSILLASTPGIFGGGALADLVYRRRRQTLVPGRINWGAAAAPAVAFLAMLLLAFGVAINLVLLEDLVFLLAALALPFFVPPVAVFVFLYRQQKQPAGVSL